VFVPYGLGTEWPTTFEGRFVGYDNDLRSIYVQPTVAFEVAPGLRVGAGFDLILSKVELNQRIDLFEQETSVLGLGSIALGQLGIPRNTEVAEAHLQSDYATAFAGHVGVQVQLSPRVSLGARYLTQATVEYDATVAFTQIPTGIILPDGTIFGVPGPLPLDTVVAGLMAEGEPFSDQGATTALPMPAQLVAGVAVQLADDLTAMADYQLTRWSVFDTLRLAFETGGEEVLAENYRDTHAARGGLEWRAAERSTVRAGYLWHTAAAPDLTVTPLLPEGRRNEITIGYGFQATDGFRIDAAYQYIRQNDRRGRMREPLPGEPPTDDLNVGVYQFRAHLFGLTFHYAF
jgi:long-chain fatty acid transport protein